ncbi:MAG: hypothetical protein LBV16_01735 [Elusimicrobiota bacterium]|nr:hypothetical protein [Elusimicrobiota bacterium]
MKNKAVISEKSPFPIFLSGTGIQVKKTKTKASFPTKILGMTPFRTILGESPFMVYTSIFTHPISNLMTRLDIG